MKHLDELLEVKKWLPYLALISIGSYMCSIAFQLGYFSAFGIDLFILNPRVDPTSLFTLIIVLSVSMVGVVEISLLNWFAKHKSFKAAVSIEILLILVTGLAYGAYLMNMAEINNNLAEQGTPTYPIHFLPISVLILFAIRFIRLWRSVRRQDIDFSKAYVDTSPFIFLFSGKRKSRQSESEVGGRVARWVSYVLIALMLFIAVPAVAGNSYATDKSNFTELVGEDESEASKQLIVGATAAGYVVKTYDAKKNEFQPEWQIINEDSLRLRPIKVTSLLHQRKH